jgi:Zn-finger nucleic acid-binding protein
MCGASVASDSPNCLHCGTRLATVSCPSCFAMMFAGPKFCPNCGARSTRAVAGETEMPCPKCKSLALVKVALGQTKVCECTGCHGLWVDAATFDAICTDRERQSIVLGSASETFKPGQRSIESKVQYLRCPVCRELMQRVNFARCSGIIVDLCKGHGSWFDRDELQHIVEFIRTGGLDMARAKEKAELEDSRRRLEAARRAQNLPIDRQGMSGTWTFGETDLFDIAGSIFDCVRHDT